MAHCFVTRNIPGAALDRLREAHEVEVWEGELQPPPHVLRERACESEGLLSMLNDKVDRELIEACPELVAVANYAVGTDNIDLEVARERDIAVGNTPDVLTDATADLAVALMLMAGRRLVEAREAVIDGDWLTWEPEGWLGRDLNGSTVGIVGHGRIGQAVERRLQGFDARVLHTGDTDLDEILTESDFVTLHAPLTEDTRGLIDEAALDKMKPTAVLVNTARGEIVDTQALSVALTEGKLGAAALDVVDPEPLPANNPVLGTPNLLILPHIGSATHRAREAMSDIAVDNLLAALDGKPMPHAVE
jgi:glyoxylate reductase